MHRACIAIVGGGLSGLYAAHLLEQQGLHDYVLLEARPTWGGRIESATLDEPQHPHRFDLGPTWYWPDFQPQLDALIQQLGLTAFEQHEAGDMMVERSASLPPSRYEGYRSAPTSVRLLGGMAALVDALRKTLDPKRLRPNQQVRQLAGDGERITLEALDPQQGVHNYSVEHVLLALPPRLAVATLRFTPTLPSALSSAWAHTTTWMAPHAKYVAVYDTPFWRDHGLSGEARSTLGPMGEMHDAGRAGRAVWLPGLAGRSAPPSAGGDVESTLSRPTGAPVRAQSGRTSGRVLQRLGTRSVDRHRRRSDGKLTAWHGPTLHASNRAMATPAHRRGQRVVPPVPRLRGGRHRGGSTGCAGLAPLAEHPGSRRTRHLKKERYRPHLLAY